MRVIDARSKMKKLSNCRMRFLKKNNFVGREELTKTMETGTTLRL